MILYKFETLNIKLDNFIRRSENLFEDYTDKRQTYNHITLLKKKNLDFDVCNVIKLIFMLINEALKNAITLVVMSYDLNEKNKLENEKSSLNRSRVFLKRYKFEKNQKESQIKSFFAQSNFMKRILTTYLKNKALQRII